VHSTPRTPFGPFRWRGLGTVSSVIRTASAASGSRSGAWRRIPGDQRRSCGPSASAPVASRWFPAATANRPSWANGWMAVPDSLCQCVGFRDDGFCGVVDAAHLTMAVLVNVRFRARLCPRLTVGINPTVRHFPSAPSPRRQASPPQALGHLHRRGTHTAREHAQEGHIPRQARHGQRTGDARAQRTGPRRGRAGHAPGGRHGDAPST